MSASRRIAFALVITIGIGAFYMLVLGINDYAGHVREQHCDRIARAMDRIEAADSSEAKPQGQVSEHCRFHEREPGAGEGGRA